MSNFSKNPITMGAKEIDIHETFRFDCVACGSCCRSRGNDLDSDIMISGPDLDRISHELSLENIEVINKYLKISYDNNLGLYVCCLRFKSSGVCSFLRKGNCSIYNNRPRTCALYPLARGIEFQIDRMQEPQHYRDTYLVHTHETQYKCQHSTPHSVYDWLYENKVPLEDTADREWFKKLTSYSITLKNKSMTAQNHNDVLNNLYLEKFLSADLIPEE